MDHFSNFEINHLGNPVIDEKFQYNKNKGVAYFLKTLANQALLLLPNDNKKREDLVRETFMNRIKDQNIKSQVLDYACWLNEANEDEPSIEQFILAGNKYHLI